MQPYVGSVDTQLRILQAHYLLYLFISLTPPLLSQPLPLLPPPAAPTACRNRVEHHAVAHVPLCCCCHTILHPWLCLPSHPHPLPSTVHWRGHYFQNQNQYPWEWKSNGKIRHNVGNWFRYMPMSAAHGVNLGEVRQYEGNIFCTTFEGE